jgi:hypothetical protein
VDPRRLSAAEWVEAAGAVVLLVALFLPWYTVGGVHQTAWQSMTVDDVLLAVIAVGALVGLGLTARRARPAVPVVYVSLATLAGIVAVIVAAWRLADPAPAAHATRDLGAWLGVAGAAFLLLGARYGMRDEGPARRSAAAEQAAAQAALERSELVPLPPDAGQTA